MLFLSVRFITVLSVIGVSFAVPLGIEYDKTTGLNADEKANKANLDGATALAHTQVGKMREGFDKYKNGDAKATKLYHAAFGENAHDDTVDHTITALQHGKIKAQLATHPYTDGTIAAVGWKQEDKTKANPNPPWEFEHAKFSKEFHGKGDNPLDKAGRAGTLIHEATHQLTMTGDDVAKNHKIIRVDDEKSTATKTKTGYTSNPNMHKTVEEVEADKKYRAVRAKSPNMHDNAESYALFASLCSQPGALRRRDVRLYNRALLEDDDEQVQHLARRNSCQLPPGYLAKKAAEKKAAGEKTKSGLHSTSATKSTAALKDKNHLTKGGVRTTVKGANAKSTTAKHLTKGAARTTVKGANAKSTTAKHLTKGAAKTTVKGANAKSTTAKHQSHLTKGAARTTVKGANAKSTTAKRPSHPTKGAAKTTVKGAKALTAHGGTKAANSNKQTTHGSKSSQSHSVSKALKKTVAAAQPIKPVHAKSTVTKKH